MGSGPTPAPSGVGGSGHGGVPPPGHAANPTTPPVQHTTYDRSENGSIDNIRRLITNAASKYPHDDPFQLILLYLLKFLMPVSEQLTSLGERLTLLDREVKALYSKLDTKFSALEHTFN